MFPLWELTRPLNSPRPPALDPQLRHHDLSIVLQQHAHGLDLMVHLRLNEKETNPNPLINFITALPPPGEERERARQLLRALAAQVKPVMKSHGFTVNSFEEVCSTNFMTFLNTSRFRASDQFEMKSAPHA